MGKVRGGGWGGGGNKDQAGCKKILAANQNRHLMEQRTDACRGGLQGAGVSEGCKALREGCRLKTVVDQGTWPFHFSLLSCPPPRWPVPRTLGPEEYSYTLTQQTSLRTHTSQPCPATWLCMNM
jgi:hypothetical protein